MGLQQQQQLSPRKQRQRRRRLLHCSSDSSCLRESSSSGSSCNYCCLNDSSLKHHVSKMAVKYIRLFTNFWRVNTNACITIVKLTCLCLCVNISSYQFFNVPLSYVLMRCVALK